jgi:hypothetical protein
MKNKIKEPKQLQAALAVQAKKSALEKQIAFAPCPVKKI